MTVEKLKFYTLRDLEELTGFDGRTIYFYVQEGLLPKLGRRGRASQYPQLVLDRLLFIKKLKELQDSGVISPITLRDIRQIMRNISPETVARVAAGEEPLQAIELDVEEELQSPEAPDEDAPGEVVQALRNIEVGKRFTADSAPGSPFTDHPDDPDEWTTVSVTGDILLTVRGKNAKSTPLVRRMIQLIRQLVGRGEGEG